MFQFSSTVKPLRAVRSFHQDYLLSNYILSPFACQVISWDSLFYSVPPFRLSIDGYAVKIMLYGFYWGVFMLRFTAGEGWIYNPAQHVSESTNSHIIPTVTGYAVRRICGANLLQTISFKE